MCKTPIAYLLHILEECNYILSVVTDDLPMYQFLSDETLKRAVCRSLEIVGEATKKIPADVKYQWNDILLFRTCLSGLNQFYVVYLR